MRDWADRQAEAGCYSGAELSSNDSKTRYDCSHDSPCHLLVPLLALVRVGVGGTPDRPQGEEADLRDGPPLRHRVQRVQQLLGADARENLYTVGRICLTRGSSRSNI